MVDALADVGGRVTVSASAWPNPAVVHTSPPLAVQTRPGVREPAAWPQRGPPQASTVRLGPFTVQPEHVFSSEAGTTDAAARAALVLSVRGASAQLPILGEGQVRIESLSAKVKHTVWIVAPATGRAVGAIACSFEDAMPVAALAKMAALPRHRLEEELQDVHGLAAHARGLIGRRRAEAEGAEARAAAMESTVDAMKRERAELSGRLAQLTLSADDNPHGAVGASPWQGTGSSLQTSVPSADAAGTDDAEDGDGLRRGLARARRARSEALAQLADLTRNVRALEKR